MRLVTWDDDDGAPTRVRSNAPHFPMFPVLLIAIGTAALFHHFSLFTLVLGLFLLSRSRATGGYGTLIVGAVLTGSGAGHFVGDVVTSGASDAMGNFGTAAGFFWLANNDRPRSNWALIPAAIIGLIGVGSLGLHVNELVNGGAGSWVLPAGVVVAGILLLGAHRMPGPLRLIGLVFVAATAMSLVTSQSPNDGRRGERGDRGRVISTAPAASRALPVLLDKKVSITSNNGPIIVDAAEDGNGTVSGASIKETEGGITLVPTNSNTPVTVKVPAGTRLKLTTTNGPITVRMPVADLDASSQNGPITVLVAGDATIEATTRNGAIDVDGRGEDGAYAHSGDDPGHIELHTVNGPIVLTHKELVRR